MIIKQYSKDETNLLKGISIILIMLHNFFSQVSPITGQNEFWFSDLNFQKFRIILESNIYEFVNVMINFWGHYGVQAFIFISGFGLTLSYQSNKPTYLNFIIHRFNKLYPSFFIAAILYVVTFTFTTGKYIDTETLKELLIRLTLVSNFIPGQALSVTGPWWFYSLIFQFYFLFPMFMWILKKFKTLGLIITSILGLLITVVINKPMNQIGINPLFLFLGHLPEFCLGIILASKKQIILPFWSIAMAFLIIIGGNMFVLLWPLTNISATIVLVWLIQLIINLKIIHTPIFSVFTFIGSISMYLFACHGYLRRNFIVFANQLNSPIISIIIALIFILVSIIFSLFIMQVEQLSKIWIKNGKNIKNKYLRFSIIIILLLLMFGILQLSYQSYTNNEKVSKKNIVFSLINDFEHMNDSVNITTDSSVTLGNKCWILQPNESYSPALETSFDTIKTTQIYKLEISLMLFAHETPSDAFCVIEICDIHTNIVMEYITKELMNETFTTSKWQLLNYEYMIPKLYRNSKFKIRVYVWNRSSNRIFVDNLKLAIYAS